MKRILNAIFILLIACFIGSCNLFNNSSHYTNTTATFTTALLNSDYNKCIALINFDQPQKPADLADFKIGMDSLRSKIGRNFGNKLEYRFITAQHQVSEDKDYSLPPNTTLVSIEFNNARDIGVLQVLFDDKTGKIDNIKSLNSRQPIPNMTHFWLFGLAAIAVVVFNIYAIVLVKRSKLKLKLFYYIAVIVINIPTFEYSAIKGIDIKFSSFQYLLGVYFQKIGYIGSVWDVGLPIGAILTWWIVKFFPAAPPKKSVRAASTTKKSAASTKQANKK